MKTFRLLVSAAVLAAVPAMAAPAAADFSAFSSVVPAATPPGLYSFADVYRLTVNGAGPALAGIEAAGEAPIRVAAPQAAGTEPRFSIAPVREPERWLLFLAGLALAGWVAHRRLTHPY